MVCQEKIELPLPPRTHDSLADLLRAANELARQNPQAVGDWLAQCLASSPKLGPIHAHC
jgi:hypothetical protein